MPITKRAATTLWNTLRDSLVNAEKTIIEIIEKKAWEPLGYDTFAEAWTDRLDGIRLTTNELRAHVVYQLLSEGADDEQVNNTLGPGSGVGIGTIKNLRRQRANGVPAGRASHLVRQHARRAPSGPRFVRCEFSAEEYAHFREVADAMGRSISEIAADAVRTAFEEMA
ncbi:hypothetical protein [Speluncibacter jeojiensis]|uniref:Uncharacterized protein n=1 Tax=Speluncibacter jeojiensis TaxID=2710754 RepID=A0A9X4LYB1_9ACTN|nr:hypothetical protein [Corynebacteriales bacterium D3-21]